MTIRLLEHFNRLIDTPDAVPRLRRFILDLAVRGKLVEQDPKDEPAGELLKRINVDAVWPDMPKNWLSASTGELLNLQYGRALSALDRSDQGPVPVFGSNGIVSHSQTALTERPAIIIGRKGSAGALNLCDGPSWTTDVAYFLIPPDYFDIRFLFLAFQTLDLARLGKGVKPGLSRSEFYQLPVVVPPLAEQHRIVAKVDELMALCDELEAAQTKREKRRDRLVVATLHGLNNGDATPTPAAPSTFEESARFYFNHLPRLTTRPEHIHQLRQTILNLAVRGKLVPQDPKDEPAMKLFDRISKNKLRLIREGEIRRQQPLPLVPSPEVPFAIPADWVWARLSSLSIEITSGSRGWAEFYASVGPKFIRAQNIRFGCLDFGSVAHVELPVSTEGKRTSVRKADLLIVITGAGVTNPGMLADDIGEAYVSQHVALIRPAESSTSRWLLMCLMATNACRGELLELAYGSGKPGLNLDNLRMLQVPLPPLVEQHRIASKVDELFSLCEKLEAGLAENSSTGYQLLDSSLYEVLSQQRE